eukprot:jgi/Ulvmu1/9588/UM054_0018.1
MEADSSAAAAPFGATSAAAAVSSGPAHDAPSAAPAAVQSNGAGHDAASTGPAEPVTAPRRAASLGASQLLPPPNGSAAAHPQPAADLPATLRPSAASDSSKLAFPPGISAAPLPGPPPREPLYAPTALASAPAKQPVAVPAAAPGAPPLPAEGVAPFQAGVDAVVLPSGATLCNPQGGRAKQRRSKFDQPAVPRPAAGSGLGSNGSVETHARIDSAPPISFGPREPSRPLLGGVRGTPDVPLPGPPARAGAAQQPYDRAPAHQPDDSRPHGSLSHPSHEAAAPAARTAAAAAPPPGADVSPSDPALVSRIRSSLATLRSDLDSKRSADPSNSPTPMLSTIPPIPGKSSTPPLQNPPLPPPMLDSTPSKSVLDALPARSAPIQPLPLPPVPTAASVPGIPGLLPKTQGPLLDAVAALPPPPTISVPPVFATAPQPQAGASAVDPAAAKPAAPPAWAPPPAPIEPAPPGLLEAMPPVPSLTGLPSMEVKPPRAFGEVWVPPAESASQSGPGPQPAAEPPPAPAPQHPPAATPPQGAAKAPAAWSQHAWGQSGPLPDDSAARAAQQGPSAHSALPSHPPAHQQYKQNPGPPPSQWDHAAQHMQTGHAQSQHTYHSGPPQLRPPSGPAMPRHRFSAPPLGLPFPQQGPDGPPHAPPTAPRRALPLPARTPQPMPHRQCLRHTTPSLPRRRGPHRSTTITASPTRRAPVAATRGRCQAAGPPLRSRGPRHLQTRTPTPGPRQVPLHCCRRRGRRRCSRPCSRPPTAQAQHSGRMTPSQPRRRQRRPTRRWQTRPQAHPPVGTLTPHSGATTATRRWCRMHLVAWQQMVALQN